MTLEEAIKKRRSVSPILFDGKSIERAQLLQILEAANVAPTHKRSQAWRFKIFEGDKKQQVADFLQQTYQKITPADSISDIKLKKMGDNARHASAIVAICMSPNPNLPEWEEVASVAMAVQNMWLSCVSLGMHGFWSSPKMIAHAHDFLQLSASERCLGFFYIGFSTVELPPSPRQPIEDLITFF